MSKYPDRNIPKSREILDDESFNTFGGIPTFRTKFERMYEKNTKFDKRKKIEYNPSERELKIKKHRREYYEAHKDVIVKEESLETIIDNLIIDLDKVEGK